jgi:hypothetical protein
MENFMRVASRTDDSVMFLDEETVVTRTKKLGQATKEAHERWCAGRTTPKDVQ